MFEDGGAAGGWTQTGKEVMDDSRINPPHPSFSVYSLNLYRTGSKPKDNVTFLSCTKASIYFYMKLLFCKTTDVLLSRDSFGIDEE